jgi:hypothetical protein
MSELKPINAILAEPNEPRRERQVSPDEIPLSERDELILELVEVGVGLRKAQYLVDRFAHDQIRRQLSWLPHRSPRRPASLLITSIEHNYDAPAYADG